MSTMPEDRPEIEIDFEGEMRALSNQSNTKNASAANGIWRGSTAAS